MSNNKMGNVKINSPIMKNIKQLISQHENIHFSKNFLK